MNQKIEIIGVVGQVEQPRITQNGAPVLTFSVGVARGGGRGPIWYRVSVWGSLVDTWGAQLSKGSRVRVVGVMAAAADGHPRLWKTGEGILSASFEITARRIWLAAEGETVSTETEEPAEILE